VFITKLKKGTVPLILNLGTSYRLVARFIPWPLHLWGNSPQYPLRNSCLHLQGCTEWS